MDAVVLGFIIDGITVNPLYGAAAIFIAGVMGLLKLNRPVLLEKKIGLDSDTAGILRTVILAFVFFIECGVVAWLILTQAW